MRKFRKFFVALLAAIMVMSLPMTAFAGNELADALNPENYKNIDFYSGKVLNYKNQTWEGHAEILARLMAKYAGEYTDKVYFAAVGWTVLNSFDSWAGQKSFEDVVKDFGYDKKATYKNTSGTDLRPIARDVLIRWLAEKSGYTEVGRVLPLKYTYVYTENGKCKFRWKGLNDSTDEWNFSLKNPYTK